MNKLKKLQIINFVLKVKLEYIKFCCSRAMSRVANEEVKYDDLVIPKGMGVFIMMEGMHFDPQYWKSHDPNKFVPERYPYLPQILLVFNNQNFMQSFF